MPPELEELMGLAEIQHWDKVDEALAEQPQPAPYKIWAKMHGLEHGNKHLRDLAASILELADYNPGEFALVRPALFTMMTQDTHPAARYRAAFAITNHDVVGCHPTVTKTLEQAKTDPELKEKAEQYIAKLQQPSTV
jgi:hypothetical protein